MLASNRFETLACQACGRKVKRKSRQQRYCSDRCRVYAQREKIGRTAREISSGHPPSGDVTNPPFFLNKNNSLQGQKSASSVPINVLGGYRWPAAPKIGRDTLRKIARAEIGEAA